MTEQATQQGISRPLLSVVVPVFNEDEVIELTHERIVDVLGGRSEFDLEIV
jgi:glycosyltransferase involved in cell wall biosynthesis